MSESDNVQIVDGYQSKFPYTDSDLADVGPISLHLMQYAKTEANPRPLLPKPKMMIASQNQQKSSRRVISDDRTKSDGQNIKLVGNSETGPRDQSLPKSAREPPQHNQPDLEEYKCDFCEYTSNQKGNIHKHIRIHTGEKPFACPVCKFRASQSNSVTRHMDVHTKLITEGTTSFSCKLCNHTTENRLNIRQHMRSHTYGIPYTCELCPYRTNQRSSWVHHRQNHVMQMSLPYPRFPSSNDAADKSIGGNQHRALLLDKKHKCDLCDYRTSQSINLRLHKLLHNGSTAVFRSSQRYARRPNGTYYARLYARKREKCSICGFSSSLPQLARKHQCKDAVVPK